LHGHESIGAYEFGMPIIKAFGIAAGWNAGALSGLPASVLPLLDARDDLRKGGTGVAIDWELAALASSVRPIVLAGGLTPENVPIAIRTASPFAVDVSSGVETRPGVKDGRRMRAFIDAVRDSGGPVPRGLFA
jgi:phosphoribosylanthranilate isomerase